MANYRIFIAMAGERLMTAAQRELTVLDEKLYLQVCAPPENQAVTSRRWHPLRITHHVRPEC
jgi:hypothetical protein